MKIDQRIKPKETFDNILLQKPSQNNIKSGLIVINIEIKSFGILR